MSDEMIDKTTAGQWFVVHCLSGHEKKVREKLVRQLERNDALPIYEVFIPEEKVSERRQGVSRVVNRKFFPGYLLVRMELYRPDHTIDEAVWSFVRNVQGVLGFLGSGNRPVALSATETEDMLRQSRGENEIKPKIAFELGETVRIKDGAFENFEGVIQEIDNERGKLKLMVSIFGRSTPVELEFWQVDRNV